MTNKKGVFFTIMTLFILTLFFTSYTLYDVIKDRKAINKRIETLNNFVFSIEQDIPRYLYISGFRAIFLMQEEIVSSSNYISDVNASFQELFYNGTLNGNPKEIMLGARFQDMKNSFEQTGKKVNANVSLESPSVFIDQEDPWNVRVHLEMKLTIKDKGNLVRWDRNISKDAYVPIENFEDPIYIVETGIITNKIKKTPYKNFTSGSNVSNLKDHNENSYYISSTSAPSFLDRMEGKKSANEYGIESLVYLPELTAQEIPTKDKSVVDYIYFSSNNPQAYHVSGMPPWFKLDNESNHLEIYNVTGLAY